ncbi:MAG: hypothetical protein IPP91_09725 [Betaproteobacteria bacterium]|nr:hypothetical protein [Betaproteobacteria bacterium]
MLRFTRTWQRASTEQELKWPLDERVRDELATREAIALAGMVSAIFVLVAIAAAFVVSLRPARARIAVRVTDSQVAAIDLLMPGPGIRGN